MLATTYLQNNLSGRKGKAYQYLSSAIDILQTLPPIHLHMDEQDMAWHELAAPLLFNVSEDTDPDDMGRKVSVPYCIAVSYVRLSDELSQLESVDSRHPLLSGKAF